MVYWKSKGGALLMENPLGLSVTSFTHAEPLLEKRYFAWGQTFSNAK